MNIGNKKIENLAMNLLDRNGVYPTDYSFGCYSEESLCIERDGTQWIVYIGERGRKEDVQSFLSPVSAYRYLIDQVTLTKPNHDAILQDYDFAIYRARRIPVGASLPPQSAGKKGKCARKYNVCGAHLMNPSAYSGIRLKKDSEEFEKRNPAEKYRKAFRQKSQMRRNAAEFRLKERK